MENADALEALENMSFDERNDSRLLASIYTSSKLKLSEIISYSSPRIKEIYHECIGPLRILYNNDLDCAQARFMSDMSRWDDNEPNRSLIMRTNTEKGKSVFDLEYALRRIFSLSFSDAADLMHSYAQVEPEVEETMDNLRINLSLYMEDAGILHGEAGVIRGSTNTAAVFDMIMEKHGLKNQGRHKTGPLCTLYNETLIEEAYERYKRKHDRDNGEGRKI